MSAANRAWPRRNVARVSSAKWEAYAAHERMIRETRGNLVAAVYVAGLAAALGIHRRGHEGGGARV